ncbi:MAG TPA: hypothetical protein VFS20_05645 [Longimicrobium sp.]|nr:hypothetical protein [Longimicrobium sp.]
MKPSHAFVAAALLVAACAPATQSTTASAAQRAFVGVWKGTGTQSDGSSWSIAAAIVGGQPGAVVGTIAYPSLACGGDLVLQGATADSLVVRERITFGGCFDRGIITLGWRSPGYLDYRWRSDTESVTARGQLGPANR